MSTNRLRCPDRIEHGYRLANPEFAVEHVRVRMPLHPAVLDVGERDKGARLNPARGKPALEKSAPRRPADFAIYIDDPVEVRRRQPAY
jgi:hypothetical protein